MQTKILKDGPIMLVGGGGQIKNGGIAHLHHAGYGPEYAQKGKSLLLQCRSKPRFNEYLTLITKFWGPLFWGALKQCLFCLHVAPALFMGLDPLNFVLNHKTNFFQYL